MILKTTLLVLFLYQRHLLTLITDTPASMQLISQTTGTLDSWLENGLDRVDRSSFPVSTVEKRLLWHQNENQD